MKKYLELIVVLFAIVGGTFGAFTVFATNARVDVVAKNVQENKETIRRNELIRRLHEVQERVWQYDKEFGFGCKTCEGAVLDTYRRLQQEIEDIERELGEKEG